MIRFLSLLLAGLSLGTVYALVAMGFVIIYKASEVLNFAHGSLLLLGAFVVARLHEAIGFPAAVAVAFAVSGLGAVLIGRGGLGLMRQAGPIPLTIATIGVDVLLLTGLTDQLGPGIHSVGHPWGASVARLGQVGITVNRLIAIAASVLIIATFLLAFRYSRWGVQMRAAAEDPEAAALMGVRLSRVTIGAWLVAGLLACAAGVFLTGAPTPGLSPTLATVALAAFPAAIIGGLTSIHGALVGGLAIGVAETLATGYQDQILFLGRGFGSVVPYVLLVAVLLWRPEGLFGERRLSRV